MKQHKLPRRALALVATLATAWVISQTADLSAVQATLFHSEGLTTHLLEWELGKLTQEDDQTLQGLPALVVQQTPLLTQELKAVEESTSIDPADSSQAEGSTPLTDPADQSLEHDPADGAQGSRVDESREISVAEPELEPEVTPVLHPVDLSAVSAKQIDISNHTEGQSLKLESYWRKETSLTLQPAEKGAQILIMHTHATEAYRMADGDTYEESDESRTTDERFNMIRVGEEIKTVFEQQGLKVVHDKTTYDYPGYNGSYGRSLVGIQTALEQNPTIQIVLDVHRDALIDSKGNVYDKTTTVDGEKVAQVMLVVGTDDGGLYHPNWRKNYTVSLKLQGAMLSAAPTLPRPIDLRSQRFNQHLRVGSVLVEVGTSGNTLQQALAGARLFAEAAGQVYTKCIK